MQAVSKLAALVDKLQAELEAEHERAQGEAQALDETVEAMVSGLQQLRQRRAP